MNIYSDYVFELEQKVQTIKKQIQIKKNKKIEADFNKYPAVKLAARITSSIDGSILKNSSGSFNAVIELTPSYIDADFTISIFNLAKVLKISPEVITEHIKEQVLSKHDTQIEELNVAFGYLNIKLHKSAFYNSVLQSIIHYGNHYGWSDLHKGEVSLFDYSSPNIAKPIGIGHLRSSVIGQALSNIYEALGYSVIRINHLGDWGTQFGALIYAYMHWVNEVNFKKNSLEELKNLYVRFNSESESDPDLKTQAREIFNKLENKDEFELKLWKKFYDISIEDFRKIYEELNIDFDLFMGESFYDQFVNNIVKDLIKLGIASKEGDNVVFVDSLDNLPSFLLKKNDGSSLYITRDVAALKYRVKTFHPDKILYVVGSEQELSFKQLFAVAKKANYIGSKTKPMHLAFGLITIEGKKMSTRKGSTIALKDVLEEASLRVEKILLDKRKSENGNNYELNFLSRKLGIGAVIYNDLSHSRLSNIDFNWDKMLNLEGSSSIYLLYTYARAKSILRKSNDISDNFPSITGRFIFEESIEYEIAKKMSMFPLVIKSSHDDNSTNKLCMYLEELASMYNSLYASVPILSIENLELKHSRLILTESVATVLRNGLMLLNIPIVEKI
ncbi:arginine--tRNA ligase [Candidatus Gracilibacteria bacterium]|nr:arginine--tRNA ligase [Candidatus Gracilibacteria bacterium]